MDGSCIDESSTTESITPNVNLPPAAAAKSPESPLCHVGSGTSVILNSESGVEAAKPLLISSRPPLRRRRMRSKLLFWKGAASRCSISDQKSAFGGFRSNNQTSSFESTSQPSQPGFGSGLFDSTTPFGASNQSTVSAASSPGFGASSIPLRFSYIPAFGESGTSGFASSGTSATCIAPNNPAFGTSATQGSSFGASCPSLFRSSSTPAFSASPTYGFGVASSTPASGASSAPTFGVRATAPCGACTHWQTHFAKNHLGSRVAAYSGTPDTEHTSELPVKFESISAMPTYKDKSHEELRWEDYQLGDKGQPLPPSQLSNILLSSAPINSFRSPSSNLFQPASTFGQTSFPPSQSSIPLSIMFNLPPNNLFQRTSTVGQTASSPFTQNRAPSIFPSGSVPTASLFTSTAGQSILPFAPTSSTIPSFNRSYPFQTPPIGFQFPSAQPVTPLSNNQGLFFNQTPLPQPSPFQPSQLLQPAPGFSFSNFGPSQAAPPGTLPAMPQIQISIGRAGETPSIQFGIPNLPEITCQLNLILQL